MSKRLCFVDLETSGLSPAKGHVILEIGILVERDEDDADPAVFHMLVVPTDAQWLNAEPGALAVNQFTLEELQVTGSPMNVVGGHMAEWCLENDINAGTVTWVGQNPKFDISMMQAWFGAYAEFVGLLPTSDVVNVMDLAKRLRHLDRSFRPVSLSGASIASALGVEVEGALHRAMGGVEAVRRNFYALRKRLSLYELSGV